MVGDHFAAAIRRHRRVPALLGFAQALVEIGEALGEIGCIGWPELGELVLKSFSDAPSVLRIKPIVRIAQGMHIAHRARDLCRGDLENLAELRHVDIAPASHLDLGISTLRDQGRQPSDLELQAHHHQQIRFLELQQEAGLRLDEMGILIAFGDGLDGNPIAADFGGQRSQVLCRGNDVNLCRGITYACRGEQCGGCNERIHRTPCLKTGVLHGRRSRTGTGTGTRLRTGFLRSACGGVGRGSG